MFSSSQSTGVLAHPDAGSQVSVVQTFPSSQSSTVPPAQVPPVQTSPVVHMLASSHGVASGLTGFEHAPVAASHAPMSWHASSATQTTPSHGLALQCGSSAQSGSAQSASPSPSLSIPSSQGVSGATVHSFVAVFDVCVLPASSTKLAVISSIPGVPLLV